MSYSHSKGWVKMPRTQFEGPVFSEPIPWQVLTLCVAKANPVRKQWRGTWVERGEWITSASTGCELCGMSANTWRKTLARLVELKQIEVHTESMKYTRIKVLVYDDWVGPASATSSNGEQLTEQVNPTSVRTCSNGEQLIEQRSEQLVEQRVAHNGELREPEESKQEGTVSPATPSPQPLTTAEAKKTARAARQAAFVPPTRAEAHEYAKGCPFKFSVDQWYDYYAARGWTMARGVKMTNWKAAMHYWAREDKRRNPNAWQQQMKPMSAIPGAKPQ